MKSKPTYQELEKEIKNLRKEKVDVSEEYFKTVFNSSSDGLIIHDNKKILSVNNKFLQMRKIKREAIENKPIPELLSGFNYSKEIYKKILNEETSYEFELPEKTNEPKVFIEIKSQKFTNNENKACKLVSIRDISDRKKAEKALKESEEKYRSVVNSMIDGFYKTDINGKVIMVSPSISKMFGINEKEIIGKSIQSFYANPDEQQVFIDKIKKIGKVKNYLTETKIKGKPSVFIEFNAQVIYKDGNYNGIEGFFKDVTERKLAEKALKESEAKLRESNKTKDKFFSIIAHDLKSPFNAILGFSEMLLKSHKKIDDEKREKLIKSVNSSAKNAFKLLENLLTWSSSQSGAIKYSPEKLHLKILLFEIMFSLQVQAEKKNIHISDNILEDELIYADKNMIATVLRNLISNAIKFTINGGSIIISSKKQKNSDFIEISVVDTGVGIPKDTIDELFLIDKNTSTEGTENETGTGLGLILCKEFVEQHNGKIWAKSEIGKGSEFVFTMPNKKQFY